MAFELGERGGEAGGIAGELRAFEIGVVLARARQRQLQQAADGGAEIEQNKREQRDVGVAQQHGRQVENRQDDGEIRQRLHQARHHVGEAHDGEVVVADVADLVRQHPGQLAQGQPSQQPFGDRNDGAIGRAGGEGVERHARDHVELGLVGEAGAAGELLQNVEHLVAVTGIERARAEHAHDDLWRQTRREGIDEADRHQGQRHAHGAPQQPHRESGDEAETADQQGRLQLVAGLVRAAAFVVQQWSHRVMARPVRRRIDKGRRFPRSAA